MPTNMPIEKDVFAVLRPRLTKALVGFSRDLPEDWRGAGLALARRPDPEAFPGPDLVLFALPNVLGCAAAAPGETGRGAAYGTFQGFLVSSEMRKFGFTSCAAKDAAVDLDRLCGQLRVAVKHVEDWLEPFAKNQAGKGNVTIANRHDEFDSRYRFF